MTAVELIVLHDTGFRDARRENTAAEGEKVCRPNTNPKVYCKSKYSLVVLLTYAINGLILPREDSKCRVQAEFSAVHDGLLNRVSSIGSLSCNTLAVRFTSSLQFSLESLQSD